MPIYTRLMSAEDYGQYSVYLSWYEIVSIFATLNMWNYLINNGLIKFKKDRANFISALQGLSIVITIFWIILYIPFAKRWENFTDLTKPIMILMFVELLFRPSYEYYSATKRFDFDVSNIVVLTVLITIFTPIIGIPLIIIFKEKGIAAIIAKTIVPTVVYMGVFVYLLKSSHKLFNIRYWIYALKFSLPLIPHFLSMIVLQQSDRIMIEKMCGESDAAIYSISYQVATTIQMVNAAILSSYVPYTYKALKSKKYSLITNTASSFILIIGIINIIAILMAPEIISILAPREYLKAIYIIPPVAISNLFVFLFNLFANIEYYWGETKYVMIASLFSALCNIILNYIFINRFGFIAAGYTTLFCYILFSICHYIFMKKVCARYMDKISIYNIKKISIMAFCFTLLALMANIIYNFAAIRYMVIFVILILLYLNKDYVLMHIKIK